MHRFKLDRVPVLRGASGLGAPNPNKKLSAVDIIGKGKMVTRKLRECNVNYRKRRD